MQKMANADMQKMMSGPIPGENHLTDPKSRAWKRPPKHDNLDEAIKDSINHIFEKKRAQKFLTVMELGIPIATLTDMYVTAGIAKGKWTPDYAIMLAGPIAHIFKMMAEGYGIDYSMGLDDDEEVPTANFFKNVSGEGKPYKAKSNVKEDTKEEVLGGFMDMEGM